MVLYRNFFKYTRPNLSKIRLNMVEVGQFYGSIY